LQKIEFGNHWLVRLFGLEVHMDTMLTAWIAMIILIIFALTVTRNLNRIPGRLQVFSEMVMEFIEGISVGQMGNEGYKHIMLIGSLFLFILVSNLLGQVPLKLYHLHEGEFASPTNDLNVTVALALIVSVYYLGSGILKSGIKYFKHYFQPFWFMAPLNFMEDLTRPLSLAIRLFGNILAGEVIILVILSIVPQFLFFAPIPFMLFELFVAFIQAFIFAVLAASYVAAATAGHDEHSHESTISQ